MYGYGQYMCVYVSMYVCECVQVDACIKVYVCVYVYKYLHAYMTERGGRERKREGDGERENDFHLT